MLGDEVRRMAAGLGVQEVADVALLPELHRLRLVGGHMRVAHPREQIAENLRLGMGELDELEAVGPGGFWSEMVERGASWGNGPIEDPPVSARPV
jgi:hypothetical protein